MNLEDIKNKISPILKRHHIKKAGIFGSYAKNQARKESDVDILVELGADMSLLDFIHIKLEIEDELGIKVDLVEYQAIKPLLKEKILNEEVPIL